MRKYITKASERIGVESTSRDGKRAQVVSYSTCENFIIRFCDGKEMKLKNWRYFIEGNFNYEKHFKAPRNREERIGEKKVMNNGLTAEVIEYRGSHDMDILFEDGGKRTGVSWRDFCIGNIAHPTIHGGNVSQKILLFPHQNLLNTSYSGSKEQCQRKQPHQVTDQSEYQYKRF